MKRVIGGISGLIVAFLLFACVATAPKYFPFNNPTNRYHDDPISNYDVLHYEIHIKLNDKDKKVEGKTKITLKPKVDNFRKIELDAADMVFTEVSVNNTPLEYSAQEQKLFINLDREYLKEETITVKIAYTIESPKRGLTYVIPDEGYPDKVFQIWTQGESEDNHYWFPCWDYPNDKATSEVYATVPAKYMVISNGKLVGVEENDGWKTYHWYISIPQVSYLVSLVIGEFEEHIAEFKRGKESVPVYYYVPKGKHERYDVERTFRNTPEMMDYFSKALAMPYPYEKYAQNMVYDFGGGMENTTSTTMAERIIRNKYWDEWENSDGIISHELAHQWFGDLLTCRNWANIWLNEGFATFMEHMWNRYKNGEDESNFEVMNNMEGVKGEDARYRRPIVNYVYTVPDNMFDGHTYGKGCLVLNMLRRIMGEDKFWKGMQDYVSKNYAKNVDTKDFQDAMEKAYGEELAWFFDEWLYSGGYPEFEVTQEWNEEYKTLRLKVKQIQKIDQRTSLFKMPLDIRIDTKEGNKPYRYDYRVDMDKQEQDYYFPLPSKPIFVEFDEDGWILKNLYFKKDIDELIYQAKNDDEPSGRIWALDELALVEEKDKEKAIAVLREVLLNDKFWGVRSKAAESLGMLKGPSAIKALKEGCKDSDGRVRSAVINNLGDFKWEESKDVIIDILNSDKANGVRCTAATALGKFKKDGFEALVNVLKGCDEKNKRFLNAVIAGLIETESKEALPTIIEYTKYGKPLDIRHTAINGLTRFKDSNEAVDCALELLKDKNEGIVVATVNVLGEIGDESVIPKLLAVKNAHFEVSNVFTSWGNQQYVDNAVQKIRSRK